MSRTTQLIAKGKTLRRISSTWVGQTLGALAIVASLAACGGGSQDEAAHELVRGMATQSAAAPMQKLADARPAATPLTAAVAAPSAEELFDWAEYMYPELFPKAPAPVNLTEWYLGVQYQIRGYANGNYLGVTPGNDIYGLGPFTNNQLERVGNMSEFADRIRADACSVRPGSCDATRANQLFDWAEYTYRALFPAGPQNVDVMRDGVGYLERAYATGNVLRITKGSVDPEVYGNGPVTDHVVASFGKWSDFSARVHADACRFYAETSGFNDCLFPFLDITLPAAASNNKPPAGTYLGLTPILHFVDEDVVMGVSNTASNDGGSLLRSSDGGVNWEQVQTNVAPIQAVDFSDASTGYAVGSRSSIGVSQYMGKSIDGGKTWQDLTQHLAQVNEVVAGIPRYTLIYNVVSPRSQLIYIAGRHTVYASGDGAEQWRLAGGARTRDSTARTSLYANTLAKVSGMAYIAGYDYFEFVDTLGIGTQDWTRIAAPWNHEAGMPLMSIAFGDANRGWAIVEDTALRKLSLYETRDRGRHWNKISESGKNDQASLFPRSGNLQYFGGTLFATAQFPFSLNGRNHVVFSTDGGKTWQRSERNGGGWPLVYMVVNQQLRAYQKINSDYYLRAYGAY